MATKRSRIFALLLMALLLGRADLYAVEADSQDAQPTITQWISDLQSDQFVLREFATRQLILMGTPAVEALTKAAQEGSDAEVTWRAVHALTEIAVAGDFDNRNPAEDSLAKLKTSANTSAATRAADVLASLPESRQSRAIAMLQSLGGIIDASGTQLQIDSKWEGKDNGLRYARHVPALRHIQIEPDASVSDEGIKNLRAAMPDEVRITQFGSAFIGVGSVSNDVSDGMTILTVQPNSPAEKAGLRMHDVITSIDDNPISGFDDLVAVIRKKKVGQVINIEFSRADPDTGAMSAKTTKVTLGPRSEMVR